MKEIYGYYTDRFGNLYLDLFEDYDAETERKECSECFNDAWDYGGELDPNRASRISMREYDYIRILLSLMQNMIISYWSDYVSKSS